MSTSVDRIKLVQSHLSAPAPIGLPSPPSHPRYGNFKDLAGAFMEGKEFEIIRKWSLSIGKVFQFAAYDPRTKVIRPIVVVADPAEAARILKKNPPKPVEYVTILGPLLGEGVLSNPNHGEWMYQRELLKPAFSMANIANLFPVMQNGAQHLVEHLRVLSLENGKKEPIEMHFELSEEAFLLIGHAALGEETEFLQKRVKDLRAAFDTVIYKGFLREQLSEDENYQKAVDLMEEFSKEVFARREVTDNQAKCPHLASLKAAGNSNENDKLADIRGNPGSLISIITQKDQKTGNSVLPAKKQRDELLSFIFAGHETTGNSMSFAVWEIAKNPAIQSKLQLEIDSMLASVKSKTGKDFPDFPDFFRLPYLNLIINETLRLWPVVPGGTRRILTEDEIIAGVKVPQGTPLAFPHYTMHRDPTIWEDPEVFNPERKWHAEAFLPFTKQPRNCLGMNLALLEMRVVLFTLFAHFKVSLAHPNEVLEAIELATLRPKNGVWVFLEERRK